MAGFFCDVKERTRGVPMSELFDILDIALHFGHFL